MKTYYQIISKCKEQRGATAVVVALAIIVLIGFVAFAVDVGYVAATKGELQNIADSGALAGAGLIGNIYTGMDAPVQGTWDCSAQNDLGVGSNDCDAIKERVRDIVGTSLKNRAAGKTDMNINDADIIIYNLQAALGNTKYDGPDITLAPTAVRVIARRDDTVGGNSPISTFFARIFGFENVNVSADATAALTGLAQTGDTDFPIGLSWTNFVYDCAVDPPVQKGEGDICGTEITLNPTDSSCAGWHNFTGDANAKDFTDRAFELIAEDDTECGEALCGQAWLDHHWPDGPTGVPFDDPPTVAGDTEYNFSGGDNATLFLGSYLKWYDDPATPELENTEPVEVDGVQVIEGSPANKPAPFIALFDYFRFRDTDYTDNNHNGVYDEGIDTLEDDDSVWTALAPVYTDAEAAAAGALTVKVTDRV